MGVLEKQKKLDAKINELRSLTVKEWDVARKWEEGDEIDLSIRIKMIDELFWCMRFLSATEDDSLHSEICGYQFSFRTKHGELL